MPFSWPSTREAAARLAIRTFGEAVTYAPASGQSYEATGVFTSAHQEVQPGRAQHSTTQPVLDVLLADMDTAPTNKDRVTVRGAEYQVFDVQPNGQGGARLMLRKS